jgi:signal transduction histidine kinase
MRTTKSAGTGVSVRRARVTGRRQTKQPQFDSLLSQLSRAFANISDVEVDAAFEVWLPRLVKFLGADRGEVTQVLADGHTIQVTHFYEVRGASSPSPSAIRDEDPWFAEQVRRGKIARFERARPGLLPSETSAESSYVTKMGLKSHLMLPLTIAGASLGALAFGTVQRYRRWPDELVRRLQLLAQVFGNALARKQARRRLQERLTFERLITQLVGTFVKAVASEVDEQIRQGLGGLVDYLRVDEISLGQVSEEGTLVVKSRVARAGTSRESTLVTFPQYADLLRDHRVVVVNPPHEPVFLDLDSSDSEATWSRRGSGNRPRSSSSSPPPTMLDRSGMEVHGFESQVSIPLVGDGRRLWGIITAVAFDWPREWTVWAVQRLRLVGEIMMAAMVRRDSEEKTRRQRGELAYAVQVVALGELTAALAHELNQPLTALRMNAQTTRRLLAAGGNFDELDEIAADIIEDATRAAGLIVRLRNLLRRHELEKAPLDLSEVIEDARHVADDEAQRHGAHLILTLESGLPNVRGDAMQLRQVLLNLVRNAAEAMGERTPVRQVIVRTYATPPDHITVSIEDNGPRIDDATFAGMFVAFHTTKSDGMGMGLAISQSIIEAHGGRLWAERKPERGLVVRFSLPVSKDVE